MKKSNLIKEIAFQDNIVSKEDLPLPIVLYPGFYGAFFGFKANESSSIVLCSCSKEAIENYIRFRVSEPIPRNANPYREFILDSMYFPKSLIKHLMDAAITDPKDIIDCIEFQQGICHECNGTVPRYSYCHEMYGGAFKQTFGWYINKQAYEFGVEPISSKIIPEIAPNYILDKVILDPIKTNREYQALLEVNPQKADELHKTLLQQNRDLWNFIEDEVRQKFGHKKIGESWTSETVLYSIIQSLFPNMKILRHYRPQFLTGLELDVFIEDLGVGIEYQGIQHFKPIKHWGGIEAFKKLKERDSLKKELCKSNNITLIYFNYYEGLNANNVSLRINESLIKHSG